MNAVSVRGVSRRFGDVAAVVDVDLTVAQGEVVGLVGANGAGKTTLMRMILGLLEPSSGSIAVFGAPVARSQRHRIGYVPQNLGLYRDLTAAENLAFRAAAFGVRPAATDVRGLVADLPLGVQRRVAFTAATQHDPDLLILDEPTSGVSPLARTVLWNLIRERAEAGAGVLVSTHHMDEAEQADRVVLMSGGRVVSEGPVAALVDGHTIVAVDTTDWERAFEVLDADGARIALAGTTLRVLDAEAEQIAARLREAGVEARITTQPATLDETMVSLEG